MPIMTRLLSREQYGLMSLVFLTLTFLAMFGRMGFQQATTRFFHDYREKGKLELQQFCTNMFYGVTFSSGAIIGVVLLLILALAMFQRLDQFWLYLGLVVWVVFFRTVIGLGQEIWRAEKLQSRFVWNDVIHNYGALVFGLVFFFWLQSLAGIFVGTLVSSGLVATAVLVLLTKEGYLAKVALSHARIVEGAKYGIPLVIAGASSFILGAGDRYIIQWSLDSIAVAQYSVVNDLSNYVGGLILSPVRLALVPTVFSLWVQDGAIATAKYLSSVIRYLWAILFPAFVGYVYLGKEVIEVIASAKYVESYFLLPFLAVGAFLANIQFLFSLGISVQKNTVILAKFTAVAGLVNIGLNMVVVPYWGLGGVAVVTIISYSLLLALTYHAIWQVLPIRFIASNYLSVVVATGVMVGLLAVLPSFSPVFVDLLWKVTVGALVYVLCLLTVDTSLRTEIRRFFA